MVSSSKEKLNAIRNSPPKKRPPKYPHLGEKIEQIIEYFSLTQKQIYERTRIPQASISKCIRRKGSLAAASLPALSTKLPKPIPMSWLTSGPEGGLLKDVLSKEREQKSQPPEADPEPASIRYGRMLKEIYEKSEEGDPDAEELTQIVERQLIFAHKTVFRHKIDVPATKRQARAVSKNVQGEEPTSHSPQLHSE